MILDWLNSPAYTVFGASTSKAELAGVLLAVVGIWYEALQSQWNWILGIANNIMWFILFYHQQLYADAGLQWVYIFIAIWGLYQWRFGGFSGNSLTERVVTPRKVTNTSLSEWLVLAVLFVIGEAFFWYFLQNYTNSQTVALDSLTTVLALLALWLKVKKKWESWILWIVADCLYVCMYISKHLYLTAIFYCFFIGICVWALVLWRREYLNRVYGQTVLVHSEVLS